MIRNPRLRQEFPLWFFWKYEHVWLVPALVGVLLTRRGRLSGPLLTAPYLVHALPGHHGTHPRARFRALSELPGRTLVFAAEFLALAWGSARHRKLFL